jgi:hypothetical protein
LLGDGARERGLLGSGVEGGSRLDESDPGFFFGGGIVAGATRYDKELAGEYGDRTAICLGAPDAEVTTENEEHLVLVVMSVPGELSLNPCHFDVLVVDLTYDSRRPELFESGTREFQRDGVLLQHCLLPRKWGKD